MIKNIYILWLQGFNNAPHIVKKCVQSWKYYNPDWNIILLDIKSLKNYININRYIPNIYRLPIQKCHISDLIRIILLKKYGGLWVDATTFCNKPLNDWLPNYITKGFFAFEKPAPNRDPKRLLSSWFLYSNQNNDIISKWFLKTLRFLYKNYYRLDKLDYFFFHDQFYQLYKSNYQFRNDWNQVPKLFASGPHSLQNYMRKPLTKEIKSNIDSKTIPLYKLTYKCSFPAYNKNIVIYYLYSTIHRPISNENVNDNILE